MNAFLEGLITALLGERVEAHRGNWWEAWRERRRLKERRERRHAKRLRRKERRRRSRWSGRSNE